MEATRKSFFGAPVKTNGEGIEPTARQSALHSRKQELEKQDSDPELEAERSIRNEKILNGESVAATDEVRVRPPATRPRNRALSELVTDHSYLTHSAASATSPRAREAGDSPTASKSVVHFRNVKSPSAASPAQDNRSNSGSKNSRKPRGSRRVQVKLGGTGGKGTWGKPGSELTATGAAIDTNDPNYDSDELGVLAEEKVPDEEEALGNEELEKRISEVILEFFEHANVSECIESLRAFKYGPLRSQSTSSTGSGSAFQAAAAAAAATTATGEEGVAGVNGRAAGTSPSSAPAPASASTCTNGANANGGGSKVSRTSSTSSGHGTGACTTCTVSTSNSAGGGIGLPLGVAARASRRSFVLYVAVALALERKQYHRELVSQLLAECVSPIGRGLGLRARHASGGMNGGTKAPLLEADEDNDDEDDSPLSTPPVTGNGSNANANPFDKASSEDSSETRSFFAQTDAEAGFDRLIRELPELVLDLSGPKLLPDQIGMFIARASADGAINRERFFEKYKGVVEDSFARAALTKAEVLLSMRLQDSCLERVWGVGGAARPVRVLRKQFEEVVREFLVNNELSEAVRALLELEVPHYMHELVHRAVCAWLEQRTMFVRERSADARPDPNGAETQQLLALFKALSDAGVLSSDQFQQGISRVLGDLKELLLDFGPRILGCLEELIRRCDALRLLPSDMTRKLLRDIAFHRPSSNRRRYLSEGVYLSNGGVAAAGGDN